jgi:hypothetical protein
VSRDIAISGDGTINSPPGGASFKTSNRGTASRLRLPALKAERVLSMARVREYPAETVFFIKQLRLNLSLDQRLIA